MRHRFTTIPARTALACVLAALAAFAWAAPASAGLLEPSGKKVWFGVSDTGDPAQFGEFSTAVEKHPAVIESFRTWGSEFRAEFVPASGEIVAQEHWCSSGFANTDLDLQLKVHGIHKVIVIGLRQLFDMRLSLVTRSRW